MAMTTVFSWVPRTPSAPGSRPPWPGSRKTSLGLGGGVGLAIDFLAGWLAQAAGMPKAKGGQAGQPGNDISAIGSGHGDSQLNERGSQLLF